MGQKELERIQVVDVIKRYLEESKKILKQEYF